MPENTYNILTEGVGGRDAERLTAVLNEYASAMSGDLSFSIDPETVAATATSEAWTRTVTISLVDSSGNVQKWFNKAITTGVSIADTSSAGTASITSTTLTFANGVATVVVSGDEAAWLGGTAQEEYITCTGAPSSSGTITIGITAAGMTGSPLDVEVELDHTTMTTVTLVADAVTAALEADETFAAFFTVDNTAGKIVITAITPAADDATMALSFTDTDTTGATFGSSTQETAGVAKETDTLTVAQATILGYTVASATSVETFS